MAPPFDPAADFLLALGFENLFDPIGGRVPQYECKGCRERITFGARRSHHARHARAVPKARAKAAAAVRATNLRLARQAKRLA